jgi:hypothetical protein
MLTLLGAIASVSIFSDIFLGGLTLFLFGQVSGENWVEDGAGGAIPLEASLLRSLNHPAIVSVIGTRL